MLVVGTRAAKDKTVLLRAAKDKPVSLRRAAEQRELPLTEAVALLAAEGRR